VLVVIFEGAPASVRGELTRWLLEPRAGVFVGRVSAEVRDRLWALMVQRLADRSSDAAIVMVHAADNEQGYTFRIAGDPSRSIRYFDGLELVQVRSAERG